MDAGSDPSAVAIPLAYTPSHMSIDIVPAIPTPVMMINDAEHVLRSQYDVTDINNTIDEVSDWLISVNLSHYIDIFRAGFKCDTSQLHADLPSLSNDQLTAVLHRLDILNDLIDHRNENKSSISKNITTSPTTSLKDVTIFFDSTEDIVALASEETSEALPSILMVKKPLISPANDMTSEVYSNKSYKESCPGSNLSSFLEKKGHDQLIPIDSLFAVCIDEAMPLVLMTLTGLLERYGEKQPISYTRRISRNITLRMKKTVVFFSHGGHNKMATPNRISDLEIIANKAFGVELSTIVKLSGYAFPRILHEGLTHLVSTDALWTEGLFRKSGSAVRTRDLISRCTMVATTHFDTDPNNRIILSDYNAHDIASAVKRWFRDLPEPLLTKKLSDSFIACGELPHDLKEHAFAMAVTLLPDSNREVLHTLLRFLNIVSKAAESGPNGKEGNMMTASNLALIFAPNIFLMPVTAGNNDESGTLAGVGSAGSVTAEQAMADARKAKAGVTCLSFMIENELKLFAISTDILVQVNTAPDSVSSTDKLFNNNFLKDEEPFPSDIHLVAHVVEPLMQATMAHLQQLINSNGTSLSNSSLTSSPVLTQRRSSDFTKSSRRRFSAGAASLFSSPLKESNSTEGSKHSWVHCLLFDRTEISSKDIGKPLWLWRAVVEIEASAKDVCTRILHERLSWDQDVAFCEPLQELSPSCDVFYYETTGYDPVPPRNYCVVRHWRTISDKGTIGIACKSIDHSLVNGPKFEKFVRANVIDCLYVLEPIDGGSRTSLTHIYRHDAKGRCSEFYNKTEGMYHVSKVEVLRKSFEISADDETCF